MRVFLVTFLFFSIAAHADTEWNDDYEAYWRKVIWPSDAAVVQAADEQLMEMIHDMGQPIESIFTKEQLYKYEKLKSEYLDKSKKDTLESLTEKQVKEIVIFIRTDAGESMLRHLAKDTHHKREFLEYFDSMLTWLIDKMD